MSLDCDLTVIPGRRVADLLAAGAAEEGDCTLADGLDGAAAAAADVGDSLVIISTLQLAGSPSALAAALDAPVYQAVVGETGGGFALMAVTDAGPRTRAFNDGLEVHTEGEPLAVEGDLPPLDTDVLVEVLARVEPAFSLSATSLDAAATAVDVEPLLAG